MPATPASRSATCKKQPVKSMDRYATYIVDALLAGDRAHRNSGTVLLCWRVTGWNPSPGLLKE